MEPVTVQKPTQHTRLIVLLIVFGSIIGAAIIWNFAAPEITYQKELYSYQHSFCGDQTRCPADAICDCWRLPPVKEPLILEQWLR